MTQGEQPPFRIGHGYDLHRLEPLSPDGEGRPLLLTGIPIEHDRGPISHSDGDALLHAVTDALLGAIGVPDIGQLFPDDDDVNHGRDSMDFLQAAIERVAAAGFAIANLDATIILERPKLGPYREKMCAALAESLRCGTDQVNIKAKTHEGVDAVGEGRAIEVHVVVLLQHEAHEA